MSHRRKLARTGQLSNRTGRHLYTQDRRRNSYGCNSEALLLAARAAGIDGDAVEASRLISQASSNKVSNYGIPILQPVTLLLDRCPACGAGGWSG